MRRICFRMLDGVILVIAFPVIAVFMVCVTFLIAMSWASRTLEELEKAK